MITPEFTLIANGTDVTSKINLDASKISFEDEAGTVADEIRLVIEGSFKKPKYEDELRLYIGTKEKGQFFCGVFKVQTSTYKKGAQNCMEITATAVDFSKSIKVKRNRSYENVSVKKIVELIAKRSECEVSSDFDDIYVIHEEQTSESDLHFLKRLASSYNALFSLKNNKLVFKKRMKDGKKSDALPRFPLELDELTSVSIENTNKTLYNSCKAIWRDTKDNEQKSVIVGSEQPMKVIKDSFESKADAKTKAQAALDKANAGTKVGDISCAGFTIYAGGILDLSGTFEDDGEYEIKSVNHTLDSNGWNMQIKIEN